MSESNGQQKEQCETCRFWLDQREDGDGWTIGDCHRRSPVVVSASVEPITGERESAWPTTVDGDWCGEWETASQQNPRLPKGTPLSALFPDGLSMRVVNALARADPPIRTVEELVTRSSQDIIELRNFGMLSLTQVQLALLKHGLRLKDD